MNDLCLPFCTATCNYSSDRERYELFFADQFKFKNRNQIEIKTTIKTEWLIFRTGTSVFGDLLK